MDRSVDRDDPQDDLVAERLAAQRQLDLVARRRLVTRRLLRVGEGQPRVAAQAAVEAHAFDLPDEDGVHRTDVRRIRPDELVPADAADEQLPVETRHEAARTLRPGRLPRGRRRSMEERRARGVVLVLGGGFDGAYLARLLGERGATIVSLQ